MEQVPISQFKNKENAYMEKGLPYEDNYGEKEMIANLANNVEFVTFADFTLETGILINSLQMHEIITRFMQLGCVWFEKKIFDYGHVTMDQLCGKYVLKGK